MPLAPSTTLSSRIFLKLRFMKFQLKRIVFFKYQQKTKTEEIRPECSGIAEIVSGGAVIRIRSRVDLKKKKYSAVVQ
jgi:hypothetical protein